MVLILYFPKDYKAGSSNMFVGCTILVLPILKKILKVVYFTSALFVERENLDKSCVRYDTYLFVSQLALLDISKLSVELVF